MKNQMRSALFLSIGLLLGAITSASAAEPDRATCLSNCKSDRLLCDRNDGHGLKCGQQERSCEDGCNGGSQFLTSPVASCEQRCEDSGQQCGIANNDAHGCQSGRDACLARCKKKK